MLCKSSNARSRIIWDVALRLVVHGPGFSHLPVGGLNAPPSRVLQQHQYPAMRPIHRQVGDKNGVVVVILRTFLPVAVGALRQVSAGPLPHRPKLPASRTVIPVPDGANTSSRPGVGGTRLRPAPVASGVRQSYTTPATGWSLNARRQVTNWQYRTAVVRKSAANAGAKKPPWRGRASRIINTGTVACPGNGARGASSTPVTGVQCEAACNWNG